MRLAVPPPVLPMLAKRIAEIPSEPVWMFEPKWDGFRVIVFRNGGEVLLQSRDRKPLNRYFPELLDPLRMQLPDRCVLDGEIVIASASGLDFDALQLRIHPAASRVKLLSVETPASIVFFDLLCVGDEDLRPEGFAKRRERLESILSKAEGPIHLTPETKDRKMAADWFRRFEGAGLDGVMAKAKSGVYEPDKRVMLKIKHQRDCDCVVAGFRWHKDEEEAVGSLLLGLYDETGVLQQVGACASFPMQKRRELVAFLAPFRMKARTGPLAENGSGRDDAEEVQRLPGTKSRWNRGKDASWIPLRPELVVEVAYEHMQGKRFRHMAQFRRWRMDKSPADCTYAQLEEVPAQELKEIFASPKA